ncbi:MAG TPA: SDR family oxidoreductase [Xanthobacteraceae bacterium]|nr:SDR family oxidoreductase [Xanthobacteraceae bacterium]
MTRTLICVGLGYTAAHYVAAFGKRFDRVIGTARTPYKAAVPVGEAHVDMLVFDGSAASPALTASIEQSDAVLVSAPPGAAGDPVLACLADAIMRSRVRTIVYLSTIGVYGDRGGAWVDETREPRPGSPRSAARLAAEAGWQQLGAAADKRVAVLRLAGIYGPGRNALVTVAEGTARRIVKPGQVFNRIHVADIAQAIDACFIQAADGVFNVVDEEPAPPQDVIAFAADLLGVAPPAEIPFEEARGTMTAMAQSFYAENRRVRNAKLKALGVRLAYPTYRDGLRALFAAGEGRVLRRAQ